MTKALLASIGALILLVGACADSDDEVATESIIVDGRVVTVVGEESKIGDAFPADLVFPESRPLRTITSKAADGDPVDGIPVLNIILRTDAAPADVLGWYEERITSAGERFEMSDAPEMRYFTWRGMSGTLVVVDGDLSGDPLGLISIALFDSAVFPPVERLTEVLLGDQQLTIPE